MGIIMLFLIMICSMQMCYSERGNLTVHIPVTSGKFQTRSGLLSYLQSTGHDYSHSYRIQTSITLIETDQDYSHMYTIQIRIAIRVKMRSNLMFVSVLYRVSMIWPE